MTDEPKIPVDERANDAPRGASPPPQEAPHKETPDTYAWGEQMPQYAVLGIGVEAWVDLTEAERDAVNRKKRDREHVLVRWETLRVVLACLRAVKLKDFRREAASPPPGEVLCELSEILGHLCNIQDDYPSTARAITNCVDRIRAALPTPAQARQETD